MMEEGGWGGSRYCPFVPGECYDTGWHKNTSDESQTRVDSGGSTGGR